MKEDSAMQKSMEFIDYTVMVLAVVLGGVSVLMLALMGSFQIVHLGFSDPIVLLWDGILSFAFFLQHSGMVRKAFRVRLAAFIPPRYHGAIYSIASGAVLILVVVLWQRSEIQLLRLQGLPLWIARGCSLLAVLIFAWGVRALGSCDAFGLRPIKVKMRGSPDQPSPFVVRGPYRWVRHPLYFCVVVLIWASPDLTADRLLLNVLWTAWIVVGTILEESDLLADFGAVYRDYQQRVPMLIPWRGPVAP
jgi:protein-S-isoprenylcysteine O-methyltransferase Ste14